MKIWKIWEHDCWGDSIFFIDYDKRRISGHVTPMIQVGDEIQSRMTSGKIARFEVDNLKVCTDPSDQFFATVIDKGYVEEEKS